MMIPVDTEVMFLHHGSLKIF